MLSWVRELEYKVVDWSLNLPLKDLSFDYRSPIFVLLIDVTWYT